MILGTGSNPDIAVQPPLPPRAGHDTNEMQVRNAATLQDRASRNLMHPPILVWLIEILVPRRLVVPWCLGGEMFGLNPAGRVVV
jgi:hypothetical protein